MGIGYSRPSRPLTDPPSTHSVHPLGISSKVNEPAPENLAISQQNRHSAADRPLLDSSSSQQGHQSRGPNNEIVPTIEDRSHEVNVNMKKPKPVKSTNPAPVSAKRPHSALIGETVAGSSKSKQHNQSIQPSSKRHKKAASTSASATTSAPATTSTYVTEPVVLARPRKSVRLEVASRTPATAASAQPKPLAAVPFSIAAQAMIEREDGELTDEDTIATAQLAPTSNPIPTRPAADVRRQRYVDRDALPPRTVAAGKAIVSSQQARKIAGFIAPAPMSASNTQALPRPKDTSSGLPYDDVYAEPTPQQSSLARKGSSPYTPHLTPWAPDAVAQRMAAQGPSHYITAGSSDSHAYAFAPHFYQQYSHFAPSQMGQHAEPQTGSPKSQDSGVQHDQHNDRRLNSEGDEDMDMDDEAAERAVAENDRLGLEQARKWAQEQSARQERRLDETGMRELVRVLLQLKSWGVPTTEFVRRGVPLSLLRAIHGVIQTNGSADATPPPPPPPSALPPPPPPPSIARDRPRSESIASSVEMDIATPTPSPEIKPQVHRVISIDETQSGSTTTIARGHAQSLLHGNMILQRDNQAESLRSISEAGRDEMPSIQDQEAEARHASEVSAIRVKLLAAKLRKQKEIKARMRKLQEDAVASSSVPPVLSPARTPELQSPELEETLVQLLRMTSPGPVIKSEPVVKAASASASVSPNLVPRRLRNGTNRAKLSDLVDQPAVVADSSSYFPTKARTTQVRRTTLAPPHPKHFVINLDTDSESEDDQDDSLARAAITLKETERRNAEALRREIDKKLAARAALEARIAAMEARKQAKKQRGPVLPAQQTNEAASQSERPLKTKQANVSRPDGMAVDVPELSTPASAMEIDSRPSGIDKPLQAAIEDPRTVPLNQLEQIPTPSEDYLRMPVDIDAGSKDVDMIHADEEQTEAEMLKEALALSSYENHAPKDPSPLSFDRDQVNDEDGAEPQLAISRHHTREIIGCRSASTSRDAVSSFDSPRPDQACRFTPYETLTNHIPLTAAQPVKIRTRSSAATGAGFLYRDSGGKLDPLILDSIIWNRIYETRRNFLLCKYEDGGGICADDTCGDLHMSRDVAPTPQDLLKLVNIVLPPSSSAHPTLQQAILAMPEVPLPVSDYANGGRQSRPSVENGRARYAETSTQTGQAAGHWPDQSHEAAQIRARAVDDFLQLLQRAIDS